MKIGNFLEGQLESLIGDLEDNDFVSDADFGFTYEPEGSVGLYEVTVTVRRVEDETTN